jgi:hypothetical protein
MDYVIDDVNKALSGITYDDLLERERQGKGPIKGSIGFSPSSETGPLKSIERHMSSNQGQFFMGGALFSISPLNEKGKLLVEVTNYTSRNSVSLHILDNYDSGGLGTTKQTYSAVMEYCQDSCEE